MLHPVALQKDLAYVFVYGFEARVLSRNLSSGAVAVRFLTSDLCGLFVCLLLSIYIFLLYVIHWAFSAILRSFSRVSLYECFHLRCVADLLFVSNPSGTVEPGSC